MDGDSGAILCIANVAHSAQAVELDLSQFAGRVPVELNAGTPFPPIGQLTYLLTLPPYGFYWFLLRAAGEAPSWHTEETNKETRLAICQPGLCYVRHYLRTIIFLTNDLPSTSSRYR